MDQERDIVRVSVTIGGIKTSVSMDGRMFYFLGLKFGGEEDARVWVRNTLARLESEWAEAASKADVGDRIRANTGLSRAIQREAIEELCSYLKSPGASVATVPTQPPASPPAGPIPPLPAPTPKPVPGFQSVSFTWSPGNSAYGR